MNNPENRIPENIAPEVLALASRYYANQQASYSISELVQAGSEVQIPAEYIQQAIHEIQAQQKRSHKQHQIFLTISAGILTLSALWSIWTYNSLSSNASKVQAAWAQVENQLQRRADLIPNLVSVTQAYAKQEQELVSLLVNSRDAYLQAVTPEQKAVAIANVNQAIKRFGDYGAANPQLQSSQLFINLQYEIAGTENRIAVERMRYNNTVQIYNQQIQQFPNSMVASIFGFKSKLFFPTTPTQ